MIDFKEVDISDQVVITCVDGERLEGVVISLEDDEGSGIGELAVIIAANGKRHIVIGQSEITSIGVIQ